jgi:hypothetical protein
MADSLDELIEFGAKIGMRRAWLQMKPSGVHFDVTEPRRQAALKLGAIEVECGSERWSRVVDNARQQYDGPGKRPRRFPVEEPDYTFGGLFAAEGDGRG